MKSLLKISQQTLWQLLGKTITSVSTILIIGSLARVKGAEEVGVLTLALAYLGIFALISDFGLNAHVLPKFMGEKANYEWQRLLGLRLSISILALVLAIIILFFYPQSLTFKLTILLGFLGIIQPAITTTTNIVFQSKLRFDLSVLANSVGALVILGLVFLLIKQGQTNPYLIIGYSLGWLISAVLGLYFARQYITSLLPVFDFAYIKKVLSESWPISATILLNLVYFRLDAFILSHYQSFTEVGVYNLAYSIFQSLLVVPAFIMNSYYPLMLKDFEENSVRFISRLKKGALLMLTMAVSGTALTLLLSPLVVPLVSGENGFGGSITSLQILSLGFPAFFLSSILMWTLITFRQYKTILIIYVIGLVFNGVANFIFIPRFSYIAASYITVFSEYFILLMQLIVLIPLLTKRSAAAKITQ